MAISWSDNTFFCPSFKSNGVGYVTHTPHRTSQRAPAVLQSITSINVVCEHVANSLGLEFEDVMELNFYKVGQKTPWGDVIGSSTFNWTMPQIWTKLKTDAQFADRKKAVDHFNLIESRWRKRGIAMVPVKYGIGLNFYKSIAIANIYADGTVLISHGACELGQGLNTKVAQAAAFVLGIDIGLIRIADTETSKAPNNTGTGGSAASECTAKATAMACQEVLTRLADYRKDPKTSWQDAVGAAIGAGVCLSAEGWYANTDQNNSYATFGAAMSEVEIDVLTGEWEIRRVDILMDLGYQLNAAIDIGQLEGGFIMALGYFFTEQHLFSPAGEQLTIGTWEYKIPSYSDVPQEFNVQILNPAVQNPNGVFGSKASAEPPLSLAASAYFAVKKAIYAARQELGLGTDFVPLAIPCTVEEIRKACAVPDSALSLPSA